jgi:mono/diheme cytochrome c family protein
MRGDKPKTVFGCLLLALALSATIPGWDSIADSSQTNSPPAVVQDGPEPPGAEVAAGRALFLKNCAHCHGASARGEEGPDLHHLDESDPWIGNRIRNGKRGEMTAFEGKLKPEEIDHLIGYLRTLK